MNIDSVLSAVRELARRSPTGRVDLADLRVVLRGMARSVQDTSLITLHHQRRIVLSRNDNADEVTDSDQNAAAFVGGCPRHIAYLVEKAQ